MKNFLRALLLCLYVSPLAWSQESQPASEPASASSTPASQPALKRLTLAAIFGPLGQVDFDGSPPQPIRWLPDGADYLSRAADGPGRINAETGERTPLYDVATLEQALRDSGAFDAKQARDEARRTGDWSDDFSTRLIRKEKARFAYRPAERSLCKLAALPDSARAVGLSPTGGLLTYVDRNDLYTIDTRTGAARRLTKDGSETRFNGVLDWVYQEELYGRGDWTGHWASPQNDFVAFLQLDESRVPTYSVFDWTQARPQPVTLNYPKAGDPNPGVRLGIVRVRDAKLAWADLSRYGDAEILIVRVGWAPDGNVVALVQDREQTWMDLIDVSPTTGAVHTLLHESSPAWIENMNLPRWLADGSFLWLSDATGYRHIEHRARDGRRIRRLTGGSWSVKELRAVDERAGFVYFSAAIENPLEQQAYRVPFKGGDVARLTDPGSSHSVEFSRDGAFFADRYSSAMRPPRMSLRRGDGSLVRVLAENATTTLREYEISEPEFFRLRARYGWALNAMLLRPADFDPAKRYPVLCKVYAGPDSPTVSNAWQGRGMLFDQYQAQQGYLIWKIDPRSSSGESPLAAWQAYRRLGETELRDIEDSLHWLIDQGWADADRIAIMGHSYGGFMTTYALTHSNMFRCGIAGAPVTDWRNYDTIYTERYMSTPDHNAAGYDATSVWKAAENLHGRLLLAHGLMDDNVHFQNSAEFIRELQRFRKQFDLMIFPLDQHGFGRGERHWRQMQLDFIRERL